MSGSWMKAVQRKYIRRVFQCGKLDLSLLSEYCEEEVPRVWSGSQAEINKASSAEARYIRFSEYHYTFLLGMCISQTLPHSNLTQNLPDPPITLDCSPVLLSSLQLNLLSYSFNITVGLLYLKSLMNRTFWNFVYSIKNIFFK